MRPSLQKVIDELHLDTRDNFTRMFALASAMLDERDALRTENESLRAECGLRQIQGYHEGKAAAEADNAALRVERDAAFALLRVCQDSVHPDTRTVILALIGDAALLAGKEGK